MMANDLDDQFVIDQLIAQQDAVVDGGPSPISGGPRPVSIAPANHVVPLPAPISDGWDDEAEDIVPEIVPVSGDVPLLYKGESNLIAGPGGVGKSWIGYAAAYSVAKAGGVAVIIDYESNIRTVRKRLKAMGVKKDVAAKIMYWSPQGSLMPGSPSRAALDEFIAQYPECFLLLDSVAKALSAAGKNENDNNDYNIFDSAVFQSWTDRRVTSLLIDHTGHVADPRQSAGRARGASSKNDRISGASYVFEVRDPWSKNKHGRGALKCVKDREGNRVAGEVSVDVVVTILDEPFGDQTLDIKFYKTRDQERAENGAIVNHTHLYLISNILEEAGEPMNVTAIRDAAREAKDPITSKHRVDDALGILELRGFVEKAKVRGKGNPTAVTLLKPYVDIITDNQEF